MKKVLISIMLVVGFTACSIGLDAQQIVKKYRQSPRDNGLRAEIIEEDIIPFYKENATKDLEAMSYAKKCFNNALTTQEANECRTLIVDKYGDDYSFDKFKIWDKDMKQKMNDFLDNNTEAISCYAKAKKAKDILPCKDPIDPNF